MKSILQAPPTSKTSAGLVLFLLFTAVGILSVEWLCEASHWLLLLLKHPGVGIILCALAMLERLASSLYSYYCSSSECSGEEPGVPAVATKAKARATLFLLFSIAGTLGIVWSLEAFHWLKLLVETPGVGAVLCAFVALERLGTYLYSCCYSYYSNETSGGDTSGDPAASTVVSGVEFFSVEQIKRLSPQCCSCCSSPQKCQNETIPGALCKHFTQLRSFLTDFLAKPHKELGRRGSVCPFVPLALKRDSVLIGMAPSSDTLSAQAIERLVFALQSHFLHKMEPLGGNSNTIFKAIVLGFPHMRDEDAPSLVDHVQQKLKRAFTASGMMLGEFHKLNRTSGLHNPDFSPLQTLFPALAMRFMVATDLVFLKHDRHYLSAYLQWIPATQANAKYIAEAKRALEELSMV